MLFRGQEGLAMPGKDDYNFLELFKNINTMRLPRQATGKEETLLFPPNDYNGALCEEIGFLF